MTHDLTLGRWIDAHHAEQVDVPARDRARALRHAARRQRARRGEGRRAARRRSASTVERHPVPRGVPARLRHAKRHQPDRAPALRRRRADDRAQRARRRRAAGRRLDAGRRTKASIENGRMYARGVAVSKSDIATYTYALAALRALARARRARSTARSSCISPTTRSSAGSPGPGLLLDAQAHRSPTTRSPRASATRSSPRTTAACSSRSPCTASPATARCPKTGLDAFRAGDGDPRTRIYAEADALEGDASRASPASTIRR